VDIDTIPNRDKTAESYPDCWVHHPKFRGSCGEIRRGESGGKDVSLLPTSPFGLESSTPISHRAASQDDDSVFALI
jgi:hypothetical protein